MKRYKYVFAPFMIACLIACGLPDRLLADGRISGAERSTATTAISTR